MLVMPDRYPRMFKTSRSSLCPGAARHDDGASVQHFPPAFARSRSSPRLLMRVAIVRHGQHYIDRAPPCVRRGERGTCAWRDKFQKANPRTNQRDRDNRTNEAAVPCCSGSRSRTCPPPAARIAACNARFRRPSLVPAARTVAPPRPLRAPRVDWHRRRTPPRRIRRPGAGCFRQRRGATRPRASRRVRPRARPALPQAA